MFVNHEQTFAVKCLPLEKMDIAHYAIDIISDRDFDYFQDDLISFDEFVRAMEASDVENKMSTKFMG